MINTQIHCLNATFHRFPRFPRNVLCSSASPPHILYASSPCLSLRLHRLAIEAHSPCPSESRHTPPQISLSTTLGSLRTNSTTIARRFADGELGLIRPKHHLYSTPPVEPLFGTAASSDWIALIGFARSFEVRTLYFVFFYVRTSAPFSPLP